MSISRLNVIVLSSEIRRCNDEVHVEISVVVFLKLEWIQLETRHTGGLRQNVQHFIQCIRVYNSTLVS